MPKKNTLSEQDARREAWAWAIKQYREDPKRLGDLAGLIGAVLEDAKQGTRG